ncbi:MAG TPA: site-2 protease family protein [Bryobacteraceae bacterium]|nr:site-2 protease family protein [Bryobacteraceae bacterium]
MASRDISPPPYSIPNEVGVEHTDHASKGEVSFIYPRTRERYWLHLLLFFITVVTTTAVGAAMQYDFAHNVPFDLEHSPDLYALFWHNPRMLLGGLPFSMTLLAILTAHEFGHYCAALAHGVDSSLPYFLPSPGLGTFGAFIRVRSPIYSKRVLFDIGAAGPLAGFVFILPALGIGLAFSKVIPGVAHHGDLQFGASVLQWAVSHLIFPGVRLDDLYLHPVARAAWVGMFMTSMNLLPVGQLDGGHILYSLFPRRHKTISKLLCVVMLPMGVFWYGWAFWGAVLLLIGRRHPAIYDAADLGTGRRRLGWTALAIFLLCFSYAPIATGGF